MSEPLTGYEATSVADVESFLDDNPAASSDEVYLGTVGHSERAIAAVAAKRAGSGGGGSTPFNGGTITDTLEIDVPSGTAGLIVKVNNRAVLRVNGDGSFNIEGEPGHNSAGLSVGADGNLQLYGDNTALISINTDDSIQFGSGATVEITPEGSLAIETLLGEPDTSDIPDSSMESWYDSKTAVEPSMKLLGKDHRDTTVVRGGGLRMLPAAGYHFAIADHAAPADAELVAGDMCIWFDQTNGAAKLMVKAKTADGTVVAGELALA